MRRFQISAVVVLFASTLLPSLGAGAQTAQFIPVINRIAGNGTAGYTGNTGAALSAEIGAGTSAATTDEAGNIFIADSSNNVIRRIDAVTGIITTVAGGASSVCSAPISVPGQTKIGDGCNATSATLSVPKAVRFYKGDMYIADNGNNEVRVVSGATGIISAYAGDGAAVPAVAGGVATASPVRAPIDFIFDPSGNMFVIITGGTPSVIEIDHTTKIVSIVAGTSVAGKSGDGGPATKATLSGPDGLAMDSSDNLFIAESTNNDVRKVTFPSPGSDPNYLVDGTIITYAGSSGTAAGFTGAGGPSNLALLSQPQHMDVDGQNNLYIADKVNNRLVVISAPGAGATYGTLNLFAGNGGKTETGDGGPAILSSMLNPTDVEVTAAGDILITDAGDNVIREVTPTGIFAATAVGSTATQTIYVKALEAFTPASFGVAGTSADFSSATAGTCPMGQAVPAGTYCELTVTFTPAAAGLRGAPMTFTDTAGDVYSEVLSGLGLAPNAALLPGKITTIAGTGTAGNAGDTGAATTALLDVPSSAVVDGEGNIYLADTANQEIRKISSSGVITRVAGAGTAGYTGDNGAATSAQLSSPTGIAVDGAGNLYIADSGNNCIRFVNAATGAISTYAGSATAGYAGDGGMATAASLSDPTAVAITPAGLLLVADTGNNVIRAIGLRSNVISTFAGTGTAGFAGDGGPAQTAQLSAPAGIAADNDNNVYVSDTANQRIRSIAGGIVSTLAGDGTQGSNGDGAASSTEFSNPAGLAADPAGDVYVADEGNNRIREILDGNVTTLAGTGAAQLSGNSGSSNAATVNAPAGVAVDGSGNLIIADTGNNELRYVNLALSTISFPLTNPGATSTPLAALLTNSGNQSLTISGVNIPASFADSPPPTGTDCDKAGLILRPATNCELSVVFTPATAGAYSSTLTVTDNTQSASAATQTVQLIATSGATFIASLSLPNTSQAGGNESAVVTVTSSSATYSGTLHFTSSDPRAVLPPDHTFAAADAGTHTFTVQLQTAGIQTVSVKDTVSSGIAATASTTVTAGPAAAISAVFGTPQSAGILAAYSSALTAKVVDAYGNPVSGVTVTFTTPTSGATASFAGSSSAQVMTNLSGIATAPALTANAYTGSFAVTATASGASLAASFSLTNVSTSPIGLSISATPGVITISPQGTGSATIAIQTSGGLSTPIQLTCSVNSPEVTCQISPSTISPSPTGAALSATLTMKAVSASSQLAVRTLLFTAFVPFAFVLLPRRRRLPTIALLLTLTVGLFAMSGCGSGSNGAPLGGYAVAVVATSGSATATTSVYCDVH